MLQGKQRSSVFLQCNRVIYLFSKNFEFFFWCCNYANVPTVGLINVFFFLLMATTDCISETSMLKFFFLAASMTAAFNHWQSDTGSQKTQCVRAHVVVFVSRRLLSINGNVQPVGLQCITTAHSLRTWTGNDFYCSSSDCTLHVRF